MKSHALQIFTLQLLVSFISSLLPPSLSAQAPNPALVGYFHNWQDTNAPYIQLDQVDTRFNIIDVAFAVPQPGTDYQMKFIPDQVSQATFIAQIQTLHAQGRKVIISIGGATAPVSLNNTLERDSFVVSMSTIINTFDFDGMDIDLEGSSLSVTGGTIGTPIDSPVINLIDAIQQIMANYYSTHNKRLILTMAPETAFVQGGQSAYGGIWGAYLPVINALRDSIELLHVQLYNSGSMYGIDGNVYQQGTADFIVAMCEAVIQGFNTPGGFFAGLPANKIAVGLPACSMAAGGGFTDTATVKAAIDYLRGNGPQPGIYTLINSSGYPGLRGLMTWSINWDASSACAGNNSFAANYESIFGSVSAIALSNSASDNFKIYPNPANDFLHINFANVPSVKSEFKIHNLFGEVVLTGKIDGNNQAINISILLPGVYYINCGTHSQKVIKFN